MDLSKMSVVELFHWAFEDPAQLTIRQIERANELYRRLAEAESSRDEWQRQAVRAQHVVMQCRGHLDGCSHGYADELWDATTAVVEDARRAAGEAM